MVSGAQKYTAQLQKKQQKKQKKKAPPTFGKVIKNTRKKNREQRSLVLELRWKHLPSAQ